MFTFEGIIRSRKVHRARANIFYDHHAKHPYISIEREGERERDAHTQK